MGYTDEFKEKIKKAYPDSKKIHELVEVNASVLGRYLEEDAARKIAPEEVVEAVESLNFQKLYQKAKNIMDSKELYNEWYDMNYTVQKIDKR